MWREIGNRTTDTWWVEGSGAQGRDRTTDTAIFSRMLYQLSYLGIRSLLRLGNGLTQGKVRARVYRGHGSGCPASGAVVPRDWRDTGNSG